jgi:3-phenylpropionate/cinnamic acid dioxygenase small subunit
VSLDVADRLAIHELLALYGHLIDEQRWNELDQVFADDLIFDASDFGTEITYSRADLVTHWARSDTPHPLAHHATNLLVAEDADGTVRVHSKGIGVGDAGRVGSVTYDDVVVRTPVGWRIASRRAVLRRPRERAGDPQVTEQP